MNRDEAVIAVMGDSIAAGLGVMGRSFADLLGQRCGLLGRVITVKNFSGTGQTIIDSLSLLPQIVECRPDWVVISFGNFDAVVRPVPRAMRWVPPRWRAKGWLDPRPYFSKRLLKGLYQRVESAVRWRYRIALLRAFGGEPATMLEDFDQAAQTLVAELLERTTANVLLVTPAGINERFYPKTGNSMSACAAVFRTVATLQTGTGRVAVCDVAGLLDRSADFFADGFHPNVRGHRKLAKAMFELIRI